MDEAMKNPTTGTEAFLQLRFQVKEEEVTWTLDQMDRQQGSNKKQKLIFAMFMAIAAIDAYQFVSTKSGFALILTMLFLILGVFYKKKSNFTNRRLAEAFAADPEQVVDVLEQELKLTDRSTSYEEIKTLYEFKQSFGMHYMENYYFVIPKRVFQDEEQLQQFCTWMEQKLGSRYQRVVGR